MQLDVCTCGCRAAVLTVFSTGNSVLGWRSLVLPRFMFVNMPMIALKTFWVCVLL